MIPARIPAVETVRANRWTCGTMLRSGKWQAARMLEYVGESRVGLRTPCPRGSTLVYLRRLPRDVEVAHG